MCLGAGVRIGKPPDTGNIAGKFQDFRIVDVVEHGDELGDGVDPTIYRRDHGVPAPGGVVSGEIAWMPA